MSKVAAKAKPVVVIETCENGHHVARYVTHTYRFLLSTGVVVDVDAVRDDSDLRAAVLYYLAGEDVSIEGVTRLDRNEPT